MLNNATIHGAGDSSRQGAADVRDQLSSQPVLARFRRALPFAGELDEAIQLFRATWRRLVLLTALWYAPFYLVTLAQRAEPVGLAMANPRLFFEEQASSTGLSFWLLMVLGDLITVWAGAAVTAATNDLVRGRPVSIEFASRATLRRAGVLAWGYFLWLLALAVVAILSIPLLVFGVLGLAGVVPLIGLLLWAGRPTLRSRRLKWLIILTTPFGLFVYYFMRWAFWGPVVMLESKGAFAALRRSSTLVEGQWFRVFGVYSLSLFVVMLLGVGLYVFATTLLGVAGITHGWGDRRLFAELIGFVLGNVPALIFAALFPIVLTLVTLNLGQSREGTDLAERLGQLESLAGT